jgi:hypothetical protein
MANLPIDCDDPQKPCQWCSVGNQANVLFHSVVSLATTDHDKRLALANDILKRLDDYLAKYKTEIETAVQRVDWFDLPSENTMRACSLKFSVNRFPWSKS